MTSHKFNLISISDKVARKDHAEVVKHLSLDSNTLSFYNLLHGDGEVFPSKLWLTLMLYQNVFIHLFKVDI